MNINLVTPQSLDALGRVVAIMRRAKVRTKSLVVVGEDNVYKITAVLEGEEDEVLWLFNKLDRLPEVLHIEVIYKNS
ncbi:MAG: ACT domain-containing protein [Pyrobaculum sp.]